MKGIKKFLAFLLCVMMLVGMLPTYAFATETEAETSLDLSTEFTEVQAFVDYLMAENDPETICSTWKKEFSWDTEKRETNGKDRLYDWSYYNGVVFEGLWYLYEVTGETKYKDYVVEYMNALIDENGEWTTNSSSKTGTNSGYLASHGVDTIKTASLLMDLYSETKDERYLTMAEAINSDITKAALTKTLTGSGNNLSHRWDSTSTMDTWIWLDGLYMVQPFRAEYSNYVAEESEFTDDRETAEKELDTIVGRMQWVSDYMYDEDTQWFYHAAYDDESNSDTFWLRSIGWYVAAIVDVMDSYEEDTDNFKALQAQLKKVIDGLYATDSAENGYMWLNKMNGTYNKSTNPYETSGSSLIYYGVMKAVNNGWLADSYADQAIASFEYMVANKLTDNVLTDICQKGAPTSSNSTFYDNEGKGVGPFIMLYAEVLEYYNDQIVELIVTPPTKTTYTVGETLDTTGMTVIGVQRDDDEVDLTSLVEVEEIALTEVGEVTISVSYGTVEPASFTVTVEEAPVPAPEGEVTVKVDGTDSEVTAAVVATEKVAEKVASVLNTEKLVAYDISVENFTEGQTAEVTIPMPEDVDASKFMVWYVGDDTLEPMNGHPNANGTYTFTTTHFSVYVGGEYEGGAPVNEGTGNLVGGKTYTLDTNGVTANKNYLIVNTGSNGTGYAMTNDGDNSPSSTAVTISNGTITVEDDADIAWVFSGSTSGTVKNGTRYLYLDSSNVLSTNSRTIYVQSQNNGIYRLYKTSSTRYLTYNSSGSWSRTSTASNIYLYELTGSSSGEAVTFTVDPASVTLAPEGKATLTGTVTVAGETVNLSDCEIVWAIPNTTNAELTETTNGVTVKGVKDGTVNIIATLSAVNGTKLVNDIVLTIPVTVQSRAIDEDTLKLNPASIKVNCGEAVDFSEVTLVGEYADDEGGEAVIPNSALTFPDIDSVDTSMPGTQYVTVTYGDKTFTLAVICENNYNKNDPATDYPKYPEDGAVRIKKTATEVQFEDTGLAEVELNVAGVSVKAGVDVILVTDLSNSMAWEAGKSPSATDKDASSYEDTKMYDLAQSVSSFADIFLAPDSDGAATKNTMTVVSFGGYDNDYTDNTYNLADSTQTIVAGSSNAEEVKSTINNIMVVANSVAGTSYSSGYALSFDGGVTYKENYGNTNYDHAFMETYSAITKLKEKYSDYDSTGRQIYVLFMTDGAPSNYNGGYYRSDGSGAQNDATWLNRDNEEEGYTNYNYRTNATAWYQYIAGGAYNSATESIPGNPLYWADKVASVSAVAEIINIGFDLDNGGFSSMTFTLEDGRPLAKVLEKLVTGKTLDVHSAVNSEALTKIYSDLAHKIRYAGTAAQATDTIGSKFTLQMDTITGAEVKDEDGNVISGTTANLSEMGITPSITVKAYELWTKDETTDTDLIGTRKRVNKDGTVLDDPTADGYEDADYKFEIIEQVTFNEDGSVATSNKKDGNIMTTENGVTTIAAKYFTYTKDADGVESFTWYIGNITDKEIALSFLVYLKGSLEGEEKKGLYYTNEEATLEYNDINGKYATQTFPIPGVAWGGASTAYEFYLVNDDGKPCDRNGNEIPFANRIVITGPYYEELNLYQGDEYYSKEIVAAKVLPAGYTLYDATAKYFVKTAGGGNDGAITITDETGTTIVVSATTPTYVQSHVAFAVKYNDIPSTGDYTITPDKVVIDYGKPININVIDSAESKIFTDDSRTAQIVGFTKYYDYTDETLKTQYANVAYLTEYDTEHGDFKIASETQILYTPTDMVDVVDKVYAIIKVTKDADIFYMVNPVTVIPATSVYYETDFAGDVFTYTTTGTAWATKEDKDAGVNITNVEPDGPQDDGTVGRDQTYGFDSSYSNDAYLSNGSSLFVEGQGVKLNDKTTKYTYVDFDFVGTGFDLISRTGTAQGAIRVNIYSDAERTKQVKSVTVLNKSESNLELYQIPVVSVNDLSATPAHYYVRVHVNAAYSNIDYPALNRGGEFYFDAIRVYDPVKGDEEAETAYLADGEYNNKLLEVRNLLLDADTFDAIESGSSESGMVFIDRTQDGADIATYETIGPNNEVYLENGQAVAFKISVDPVPASIDVGAKTITGGTAKLSAVIADSATTLNEVATVASSAAQNYSLMDCITSGAFTDSVAYVILQNTGKDVLSITDIKIAYGTTVASDISVVSNPETLAFAVACMNYEPELDEPEETPDVNPEEPEVPDEPEVSEPETPEEETPEEPEAPIGPEIPEEPNYDIIDAEFSKEKVRFLGKATLTVTTTQDVGKLIISNQYRISTLKITGGYVDNDDGTRTWTVNIKPDMIGKLKYTITGVGSGGVTGESTTVRVKATLF